MDSQLIIIFSIFLLIFLYCLHGYLVKSPWRCRECRKEDSLCFYKAGGLIKFSYLCQNCFLASLLGKNKYAVIKEIERNNLIWRVVAENKNYYMLTRDFKTNRVNIEILDRIVVRAYLG